MQSARLILPRRQYSFGTVTAPGPIRKRLPPGQATGRNLNQVKLCSNIGFLIDQLCHFTQVTQSLEVCSCICKCSLSELLRGLKHEVPGMEPAPRANPALSTRLLPPERLWSPGCSLPFHVAFPNILSPKLFSYSAWSLYLILSHYKFL